MSRLTPQTGNLNPARNVNTGPRSVIPRSVPTSTSTSTSTSTPTSTSTFAPTSAPTVPTSAPTSAPTSTSTSTSASARKATLVRPAEFRQSKRAREKTPPPSSSIDDKTIPRLRVTNEVSEYYAMPKLDNNPPNSRAPCICKDMGNATPRFMRMTMYNIPMTSDMCNKSSVGFACAMQPMANVGLGEEHIPIVDAPTGPIRCESCHAYMNPHAKWANSGRAWICNICYATNECPSNYRATLDGAGQRVDRMDRYELHRGSVDYVASKQSFAHLQKQPLFFFVIDVTTNAYHRGLVYLAINSIRNCLHAFRDELKQYYPRNSSQQQPNAVPQVKLKVGFLTYDTKIHLHSLSDGKIHVISQVDDPFVALPVSELVVSIYDDTLDEKAEEEQYAKFDQLLERVPDAFSYNNLSLNTDEKISWDAKSPEEQTNSTASSYQSCFGSALTAAAQITESFGGKIFAILTCLPNIGVGKLIHRENPEWFDTEKERQLFQPNGDHYETLMRQCVDSMTTVDIFACSTHAYLDLATVGYASRRTGGQLYYYPNFYANKDGIRFQSDLLHDITRTTVFNCVLAIRASKGVEIVDYMGALTLSNNSEVAPSTVNSDWTFAVRMQVWDKLEDQLFVTVQLAMLYSTIDGSGFIRVHTISLPVVRTLADVFRGVDLDAVLNVSLKQAVSSLLVPLGDMASVAATRQAMCNGCVEILYTYRKYCAPNNAKKQLVLPESLKLLPLYTLGMIKSPMLAANIASDERIFELSYAAMMPVSVSLSYVHPYVYPIHDLQDTECIVSSTGRVLLPGTLQLTKTKLEDVGIYVVETGRNIIICIGSQCDPDKFNQAFVALESNNNRSGDPSQTITLRTDYMEDISDLGYRLSLLLSEIRYNQPIWLECKVIIRPDTSSGADLTIEQHRFLSLFIEDPLRVKMGGKSNENDQSKKSYADFLVWIHQEIQRKWSADDYL